MIQPLQGMEWMEKQKTRDYCKPIKPIKVQLWVCPKHNMSGYVLDKGIDVMIR